MQPPGRPNMTSTPSCSRLRIRAWAPVSFMGAPERWSEKRERPPGWEVVAAQRRRGPVRLGEYQDDESRAGEHREGVWHVYPLRVQSPPSRDRGSRMGRGRYESDGSPAGGTAAADPAALEAFAAALTAMADEVAPPLRQLGAAALGYQLRPHPGGPDLGAYVEGTDRASLAAARLAAMAEMVREVGLAFHASDLDPGSRALRAAYRLGAPERGHHEGGAIPLLALVPPAVAAGRAAEEDDEDEDDVEEQEEGG